MNSNKKLNEDLATIHATSNELNEMNSDFKNITSEFSHVINEVFLHYREIIKFIQQSWESVVFIIKETIDNAPAITKKVLTMLGQHGWYVSLEMPMSMPMKMVKRLLHGEMEVVDDIMCKFLELKLESIEKFICDQYPKRTNVIKSAFFAHKIKEYNLSIPVFLAQADGICCDSTGYQLYSKIKKIPKTSQFVEQFTTDSFIASILEPLRVPMPISANPNERNQKEITFNRHQILHGEVFDYGTEINSYKAISLLNYLCSILPRSKAIIN